MNDRAILVVAAGEASGSRAAAAALVCAGSNIDRPGLLIEVDGRPPRPTLIASTGARKLEDRLRAHLPDARAASRGQTCHLTVPGDDPSFERVRAAVPLGRDAVAVVHLPPSAIQPALAAGIPASGVLLCADLDGERALVALAARDLVARGLRVKVLRRPLPWVAARRALFGVLPANAAGALPARLVQSLLESQISVAHTCYSELDDAEIDSAGVAQQERRGDARPGRRRGLHRHPQRQAGR